MKIVFITPVTPYKENMRGPSGHPYHLMIERPDDVEIEIFSFNQNNLSEQTIKDVEKELNVRIHTIKIPQWISLILKFHLTFLRLFLKYPLLYYTRLTQEQLNKIDSLKPDLVWIYSQEYSGILKQFTNYKILFTVPDCYSLHWYRKIGLNGILKNSKEFLKNVINYRKYYKMENTYSSNDNIRYHLVGDQDATFLREINPLLKNVDFIRHPHYEVSYGKKQIKFSAPKIKLLFASRYDFYCKNSSDILLETLLQKGADLISSFSITFLGKEWDEWNRKLQNAGWDSQHITFAENYIEEIIKHDIQINAIDVGTGTKGKVLDAISNGLLMIGSFYALENIAVENDISCIQYKYPTDIIQILNDIKLNISKYEKIAELGRTSVLKEHNRTAIAQELFHI